MSDPPRREDEDESEKDVDADEAALRALMEAEAEAFAARPEAEKREILEKDGYDEARLDALITGRLREAGLPSIEEIAAHGVEGAAARARQGPASQRASAGRVSDLGAARDRRAARTRWVPLLAAAAAAAVVGIAGTRALTTWRPAATVTYPTYVAPPPEADVAAPTRRRALALCAQRVYGKCLDLLDRAREVDPSGDAAPEVQAARAEATRWLDAAPSRPDTNIAKPQTGRQLPLH